MKDVKSPKMVAPAGRGRLVAFPVQFLATNAKKTESATAWIAPKVPFRMFVSVTYSAPPCPRVRLMSFATPSMLWSFTDVDIYVFSLVMTSSTNRRSQSVC